MAIRVANATAGVTGSPKIVTAYDGNPIAPWNVPGGITLGIGGDNSNSSNGTFYEGCIVSGRPSDATDDLILKNVQSARYGANDVAIIIPRVKDVAKTHAFKVSYNSSSASAVISYTMQDARRVTITVFNQQGRQIATLVDGVFSAGQHEAVWNARRVPAGVYALRTIVNSRSGWTGRIVVGK